MLNKDGHEVLDTTPVAAPVGWRRPPTMQEQIQRYVRFELSRQAGEAGEETFEEADDFDVGDDPELSSPYELDAEVEKLPRWREDEARRQAVEEAERRFLAKVEEPPPQGGNSTQAPSPGALGSQGKP